MNNTPAIRMENIVFRYGAKDVLNDFSLEISAGKIYCLVGSSGSGKTTTLCLMNGLLRPEAGRVLIHGKEFDFANAEEWRRSMGYTIQGSGLFPHMNLEENLSIIARKVGWKQKDIDQRINELCALMSLPKTKNFLSKKPRQISGGQQQRVGIARALFLSPQIMLMDEPFSALDPITRRELHEEFVKLQSQLHLTIVLVTHDLSEAFSMADEIVLLNNGKIEQKDRPSKFLLSPNTPFVQSFIQSHSPGNRLKEIYLYSVISTDLYTSHKNGTQVTHCHLETGEKRIYSSLSESQQYLLEQGQTTFYWVDETNRYLSFQEIDPQHSTHEHKHCIDSTESILEGMKQILKYKIKTLPALNPDKKVVGVFSEEALDAL